MSLILIIDDSPTEVHVLKGMLEKHGFKTESAADGAAGIAKARAVQPDLILMDIVMPGTNGFQATRELSKDPATSNIPVIMVTTKDQKTDRIWAERQGAQDYLVKPVSEADLVAKAKAALASGASAPTS